MKRFLRTVSPFLSTSLETGSSADPRYCRDSVSKLVDKKMMAIVIPLALMVYYVVELREARPLATQLHNVGHHADRGPPWLHRLWSSDCLTMLSMYQFGGLVESQRLGHRWRRPATVDFPQTLNLKPYKPRKPKTLNLHPKTPHPKP